MTRSALAVIVDSFSATNWQTRAFSPAHCNFLAYFSSTRFPLTNFSNQCRVDELLPAPWTTEWRRRCVRREQVIRERRGHNSRGPILLNVGDLLRNSGSKLGSLLTQAGCCCETPKPICAIRLRINLTTSELPGNCHGLACMSAACLPLWPAATSRQRT
jgi:hypothetical protein